MRHVHTNLKCNIATHANRVYYHNWMYKNKSVKLLTVRWFTPRLNLHIIVKPRVKHASVTKTNGHLNRLPQEVLCNYHNLYYISIKLILD